MIGFRVHSVIQADSGALVVAEREFVELALELVPGEAPIKSLHAILEDRK